MQAPYFPVTRAAGAALIALVTFTVSCREGDEPTAPPALAAPGTGDPTVSSVVPDSSLRGVTLDVTVRGSGFDQGSAVKLERQGVPAAGITTNATTFVTSRRLIANITIAAEADTGKYDVAVTTSGGRKGVGIELFTVAYVLDELGIIGGTWSRAHAINDLGEVVGASCTQDCLATAFYWSDGGGQEDLGGLQGYSRSEAYAINDRGQVFGVVKCLPSDPGCGGVSRTTLVRWERVGGTWTIAPMEGCSVVLPVAEGSEKFLINNNDECVGRSSNTLVVQTLSGTAVVSAEPLPSLFPGGNASAYGISDPPDGCGNRGCRRPPPRACGLVPRWDGSVGDSAVGVSGQRRLRVRHRHRRPRWRGPCSGIRIHHGRGRADYSRRSLDAAIGRLRWLAGGFHRGSRGRAADHPEAHPENGECLGEGRERQR